MVIRITKSIWDGVQGLLQGAIVQVKNFIDDESKFYLYFSNLLLPTMVLLCNMIVLHVMVSEMSDIEPLVVVSIHICFTDDL